MNEFEWKKVWSKKHQQHYWWCAKLDAKETSASLWFRPDTVQWRYQQGPGSDCKPYQKEDFVKHYGAEKADQVWGRGVKVEFIYKR